MALEAAVGRTPWGTGPFPAVVERVRGNPAHYYAQQVAGSGAVSPPKPPAPAPLPQEDEMEPIVYTSATREILVWPSGPATLLTVPGDGSILVGEPQPYAVKRGLSEQFIDACLARPA